MSVSIPSTRQRRGASSPWSRTRVAADIEDGAAGEVLRDDVAEGANLMAGNREEVMRRGFDSRRRICKPGPKFFYALL